MNSSSSSPRSVSDLSSPRASVILPNYNRAHLLGAAVASVLNQTFDDFELLIIDDASTDDSRQIIAEFRDDRIRALFHEQNQGGGGARNTGIFEAKGQYLAFLDSDDEWLPDKLAKQVTCLEERGDDYGIVFCGATCVRRTRDGETPFAEIKPEYEGDLSEAVFAGLRGVHYIDSLVRTSLAQQVGGFDSTLRCGQDWDFIARVAQTTKATSVAQPLVRFYFHEDDHITGNLRSLIVGTRRLIEKHHDRFLRHPRTLARWYQDLGRYYLLSGQNREAFSPIVSAMRYQGWGGRLRLLPWLMLVGAGNRITGRVLACRRQLRT